MKVRAVLAIALAAGVFAWGIVHLLELRFERGDVYAEFSTFRSDPAGARALYESLSILPGVSVTRNFQPVSRIETGPDTTLLFLGVPAWALGAAETESAVRLEELVRSGARLVVGLDPVSGDEPPPRVSGERRSPTPARRASAPPRPTPAGEGAEGVTSLQARWGFEIASERIDPLPVAATRQESAPPPLPPQLPWHGTAWFRNLSPSWRAVYSSHTRPVVIERALGRGTLVLCSDSSFASNLALERERETGLLVWLMGPHRHILFDESHLGVEESTGVATLARRYRLEGLAAGIVALALLFAWKNAIPFAPPLPGASRALRSSPMTGRHAFEGLEAVLRRHIAPSALLAACVEQWKRSLPHFGAGEADPAAAVEAVVRREREVPAAKRDILSAYRRASAAATAGKRTT